MKKQEPLPKLIKDGQTIISDLYMYLNEASSEEEQGLIVFVLNMVIDADNKNRANYGLPLNLSHSPARLGLV